MRLNWLKEGFVFIFISGVFMFFFFDEEPLFDATDWNGIHVVFLVLSVMAVIWENVTRARYGQFVYNDQVLLFATFSFWFFLENYFSLIVVAFCFHSLTPLESELIELVEVYQTLTSWISSSMLPAFLIMSLVLGLTVLLNLSIGWASFELLALLTTLAISLLLISFFFLTWDLIVSGMSSISWFCDTKSFYLQPKSALVYDSMLSVQDQFDWHSDSSHPFAMRFEDLLTFFLQIFNICSLSFCLVIWVSFAIDLFQLGIYGVSYTYVAVILSWTEHVVFNFALGHIVLFLTAIRISLRTPIEVWLL